MEYVWYKSYDKEFPRTVEYPDKTMYELFADSAAENSRYTACTFLGTELTFSKLHNLVNIVATALSARGIKPGDTATICLPNTPHAVIAFYAINRIGAIANMLHPLTPSDELEGIITATRSRCIFVLNAFLPKYADMLPRTDNQFAVSCAITDYLSPVKSVGFYIAKGRKIKKISYNAKIIPWKSFLSEIDMKDMVNSSASNNPETKKNTKSKNTDSYVHNMNLKIYSESYIRKASPTECAVYLHSGGTMGNPKTIMLSSANMNVLALQGPSIVGISNPKGMKMATILPLFHGFGLCMGMHTMMVNAINAILVPIFSADSLAMLLKNEKPNFIAAVPTLLEGIMKNKAIQKTDLSYLKAVFCGGDTLSSELKRRFDLFLHEHNCTAQVREGYGLTETVTVCSVNPIGKNKENTVGIPLADMVMKIVELNTTEELPVNTPGEICVTGPTVMLGYLDDPEATKDALKLHSDGKLWVHTGDYGYMDDEGYFHFISRMKRIIKVSGIPVFPSQIEDVIASIENVREVSVIGIPHPYKMQVIKAYVALTNPSVPTDRMKEEILKVCEKKLIKHAIPVQIEFIENLPRTKVGKVDTVALEKMT